MRANVHRCTDGDVATFFGDRTSSLGISCLLKPAHALDKKNLIVKMEVICHAGLRDEFRSLLSDLGIGRLLALTVMCEVGEISRFNKVGSSASNC